VGLAVAVLAVLPMVSCSRGGGDSGAYVLTVRGVAEVTGPSRAVLAAGRHKLAPGQTVRITKGTATLGLPGRGSLELRAGSAVPGPGADSTVRLGSTSTLLDGDGLMTAAVAPVRLAAGGATFVLREGAARLRRSSGVTLGVYAGKVEVAALGRTLPRGVSAFRQVAIADTGALPRRAVPLVFDRRRPDPWDLRFLGEAMDLGEQLERRSLALSSTLRPPSPPDAGFLASVVPALRTASGFGDSLVDPGRSVGETVVGASIALGGAGRLVSRWNAAFAFRSEGADWGLVAADQQARRQALFGVLDGVLDVASSRRVIGGALVPAGPSGTPTASPTTRPTTPPSTPAPLGPQPAVPPITAPGAPTVPGTPSDPGAPTAPSPPGPLGQLVDGLLGPSGQGQAPVVGGVLDTVGGLVGGVLGLLDGPTG
jgi:hypothetical protein